MILTDEVLVTKIGTNASGIMKGISYGPFPAFSISNPTSIVAKREAGWCMIYLQIQAKGGRRRPISGTAATVAR